MIKMPQQLIDTILVETYTRTDALNRLCALKKLALSRLFGQDDESTQQEQPAWLASLTRENAYQTFDALEAEIKKIQPLTIFLPFEASDQVIMALGRHLRQLFGKNFLAEIKYDPTLLAGPALVWNGVYKDYSIRRKINDNRQAIINIWKK